MTRYRPLCASRPARTQHLRGEVVGLDSGSRHRVYKRYFTGAELAAELGSGEMLHEGRWFVVDSVRAAVGRPAPGTANA